MMDKLPSLDELQTAMSSPVVPYLASLEDEAASDIELSADEMLRSIYEMVSKMQEHDPKAETGPRPGALVDSSYNSSTHDYNGNAMSIPYNGGAL